MTQSPATPPVCDARPTPLPCPFCGEPAIRMVDLSTDPKTHSYRCDNENCDVRPTTCQKTSALVAKNLWNTRALPRIPSEEATEEELTEFIRSPRHPCRCFQCMYATLRAEGYAITRAPGAGV